MEVTPSSLNLTVGDTYTLAANVKPDNATDKTVTWESLNSSVAKVDNKGVVTAVAAGSTTIKAKSADGVSGTCPVEVTAAYVPVTSLTLDMHDVALKKGETYTLHATVTPADATTPTLTWKSSSSCVTVNNGILTAVAGGEADITVSAEGGKVSDVCHVKVTVPVTGVSLSYAYTVIYTNETATPTATIEPADASNKNVSWSVSPSIVTLYPDGLSCKVVPNGTAGTVTVTVKTEDGGKTASCTIEIEQEYVKATSVTVTPSTLSLKVDDTYNLSATVSPSNATSKTIQWKSLNTGVAKVDSNGKVTAVAPGTATIRAEHPDGVSGTCTVTVSSKTVPVTSITLSKSTLELKKGEYYTLTAVVYPSNATNKSVNWSSDNSSVATVNSSGTVTAVAPGTANITAKSPDGPSASCKVTVTSNGISSVKLSATSLTVIGGTSKGITATISPSDAENTTLIWKTTNSTYVKLNEVETSVTTNGSPASITVFGSRVGEADVTVAAADNPSKILATCHVTVPSTYVQTLYFKDVQGKTINLKVGQSQTLKVIYGPENADPVHLSWSVTGSTYLSRTSYNGFDEATFKAVKANGSKEVKVTVKDDHCSETAVCYFKITE